MNRSAWLLMSVALAVPVEGVLAQAPNSPWRLPEPSYRLDFNASDPAPRIAFLDEGMAREIALDFMIIRHKRISVEVALPDSTLFRVEQTNPKAVVDVVETGTPGKFDVVARVAPMTLANANEQARNRLKALGAPVAERLRPDARKLTRAQLQEFLDEHGREFRFGGERQDALGPAREAYLEIRTVEELAPEIRRRLEELAAKRTRWVSDGDRAAWREAEPQSLFEDYLLLLPYEILDDHLRACGLDVDSNVSTFRRKLESRVRAVNRVLDGSAAESGADAVAVFNVLEGDERSSLRAALTVNLRCRVLPKIDPQDPNALWYNAQRLAARARGVASIRVEGQLDPAAHDRVDWWFVEGYQPDVTPFEKSGRGFRVDPPYLCEGGARLRVSATGKQKADYALEFRAAGASPDDLQVVIHESPSLSGAEHPF